MVFVYQMESKKYTLIDIYSQTQFSHKIEDGKRSYEPIGYPKRKIIQFKNY
jgi:hypothetical protein